MRLRVQPGIVYTEACTPCVLCARVAPCRTVLGIANSSSALSVRAEQRAARAVSIEHPCHAISLLLYAISRSVRCSPLSVSVMESARRIAKWPQFRAPYWC